MVRFIFVCMAIVALSFLAIPFVGAYKGISEQRAEVLGLNEIETAAGDTEEITFEELYASADELNDIETAAGDESLEGGFWKQSHPALAETASEEEDL